MRKPMSQEANDRWDKERGADRHRNIRVKLPKEYEDWTKEELFSLMMETYYDNKHDPDECAGFSSAESFFNKVTGLNMRFGPKDHGRMLQTIPDMFDTIQIQRKKINGLRKQMQEMNYGYWKKLKRLMKGSE